MSKLEYYFKTDITDNELIRFRDDAARSGRLAGFFYDRALPSSGEFIRWVRDSGIFPWFVAYGGKPIAMCALNGWKGKTAWGHFLLLPVGTQRLEGTRIPLPKAVTVGMLSRWLYTNGVDDKPILDIVLGSTPSDNRGALHLVKMMGGKIVSSIPGSCYLFNQDKNVDGIISVYSRETIPQEALDY